MTGMLASTMNLAEAEIALACGADIIDLKDPKSGALGALSVTEIAAIVKSIAGRVPVSATVGDLPLDAEIMLAAACNTAATGVDYVKIGFFGGSGLEDCIFAMAQRLPQQAETIAVLFADLSPAWRTLLPALKTAGFAGVMIDTANKSHGGLRACMDDRQLAEFVTAAKTHRLLTGLAGSLSESDIAPLLNVHSDYLGFRTALCGQMTRTGNLDENAFVRVRNKIPGTTHFGRHHPRLASCVGASNG